MALYTRDSVDRAKQAIDIVELVGARTELRRVGQRHVGLCPFHDERTPSFSVSADRGLYYCFGCGVSGDGIRFVQETEGLDFRQAIEHIADRYGVELKLEREDPHAEERRRRRERLLGLVDRAAAFYDRFLWDSGEAEPARAYLASRGLADEVLRGFRVGYAPAAWDRLTQAAARDGFSIKELAAAGLVARGRDGALRDRFRERIVFPLADPRGRTLGFGARAVRADQQPKYLNTSESEIYHKGRQLFGIDRARAAVAKAGHVVAVEGYTDVLALHQAGVPESVAIMGTALTQEQLAELGRAAGSGTVYLALDADRSGQEAMLRAARAARSRGMELRVVGLPDGRDPAELVAAEGAAAFRSLLDSALSVVEFEVRRVLAGADLSSAGGRDRALAAARPLIASAEERSATRDELVRLVADRLDVPPSYLATQVAEGRPQRGRPETPRAAPDGGSDGAGVAPDRSPAADGSGDTASSPGPHSVDVALRAERTFLAMCVAEPALGRGYLERLDDEHLSSPALRAALGHLASHLDSPLSGLPDDPALEAQMREIVMRADEEPSSEAALELGFLQLELRRVERSLREARRAEDFARQRELWGAREKARGDLSALMGETA